MKIVGVTCSPRCGGTTFQAMTACLAAAREVDSRVETVHLELAEKRISPVVPKAPGSQDLQIEIADDFAPMAALLADPAVGGLIIGTPVYFGTMTAQCKTFIDRLVMFYFKRTLCDRVGGALAVGGGRNGGQEVTIQGIHAAMLILDMVIVSDGTQKAHFGGTLWSGIEGGLAADKLGLETARNLGRRVAGVALKLRG